MTELERIITALVRTVKQNPSFEDIRFINAYNSKTAEKPAEGIAAFVEMAGFDSKFRLNIRLVGGSEINGHQLGYTAVELAAALKEADTEKHIDGITLSETKYDKSTTAFYRDIRLSLLSDIGGFDVNNSVILSIGSNQLSGVTAFKCEEKTEGVSLYEFNRGEPYAVINSKSHYEITIEIKSLSLISFESGFVLRVVNEGDEISFLNCVINRISTSVNTKGQIVYMVRILSTEKVTA
ncbi:MAG: hypothetical protein K6F88_03670 [Ruminococcus sp.]|nr:hypothetical protein [Ruminococcus sp.]